ncbi:MAG: cell division protein FtsA [Hyphomicrobiaceae bacterium]|nr:cell division protein FtsA [Hyphomicrobiaceae bacterium]
MFRLDRLAAGGGIIGLLDIGTSKIACLIVEIERRQRGDVGQIARIIGVGHKPSQGIKSGVVTDFGLAEPAVRACIGEAERASGVTLEQVLIAVSCGRVGSQPFSASAEIHGGIVTDADIERVLNAGRVHAERSGRRLLHLNRLAWRLDGIPGVRDPRGMSARRLTGDFSAVSTDESPLRNLSILVERCFLRPAGFIAAPYASALAATTREERQLGVTAIDIGGGTTKIAMLAAGQLVFVDVLAVGSDHLNVDIAQALRTPLAQAERIKALYGTLLRAQSDELEGFTYQLAGAEAGETSQATKADLARVIAHRFDRLFEQIDERLERSGMKPYAGRSFVVTGGGSGLVGLSEFASSRWSRPVRTGGAGCGAVLPPGLDDAAFSTVVGLLLASEDESVVSGIEGPARAAEGYFGRVGRWLLEGM